MQLVLDTNVVVSGVLWGGKPRLLLKAAERRRVKLFTSAALLDELRHVISDSKFGCKVAVLRRSPSEVVEEYARRTE